MNVSVATYEVSAFNTAVASENKIHDDSIARRFGFRGGLVPGVEVYAYMAHMPVARWGRAWLEKGEAACRFLKPVYDGALARITATDKDHSLSLCVESAGLRCATGVAFMPSECRPAPAVDALPASTLPAMLSIYLDDIRETDPVYVDEGLVHPGQILRLANNALVQNVVLGPWIHVGSKVRNHTAVRIGEKLTLRSKITSNVVSKGHAIVEFDAIVVADGARTVAEITHAAIWRPRQVAETGCSRGRIDPCASNLEILAEGWTHSACCRVVGSG